MGARKRGTESGRQGKYRVKATKGVFWQTTGETHLKTRPVKSSRLSAPAMDGLQVASRKAKGKKNTCENAIRRKLLWKI